MDAHDSTTLLVGCGKVGTALGRRLVGGGGRVVGLRRDPSGLPAEFSTIAHDLRHPLHEPLPAVDAMMITLTPRRGDGPGYRTQLAHLADALPTTPTRTVFVSSTGVFDRKSPGRPLTERDTPHPSSERAAELLAGETAAIDLFGAMIVRPAGIYGPGREFLLRQVLNGAPVNYGRRTNRIHEHDLVRTLEVLLRMPQPPALLHAVDAAPARLGDVVTFIADELGVAPPPEDEWRDEGTELDGSLLHSLVGALEHPDYRSGYRDLIARRGR